MSETAPFDAKEISPEFLHVPMLEDSKIFAGNLVAVNSDGRAVIASDTAGLRVVGRAEQDVDNTGGAHGDKSILVKRSAFIFKNSATNAVDADDIGKIAFVEDSETVAETSTHKVKAGRIVSVTSEGVGIDTSDAQAVPSADTLTALTFTGGGATGPEVEALRNAVLALLQAQGLVK